MTFGEILSYVLNNTILSKIHLELESHVAPNLMLDYKWVTGVSDKDPFIHSAMSFDHNCLVTGSGTWPEPQFIPLPTVL